MRGRLVASALLACSAACASSHAQKPRQADPTRIAWQEIYGRPTAPPEVRWIEGDGLGCREPSSGKPGFPTPAGCRQGLTVLPTDVSVAGDGQDTVPGTPLAHELLHAVQAQDGVAAPNHGTAAGL